MQRFLFGVVFALIVAPVWAHEYQRGDIIIIHPYAHATAPGASHGEGYMGLLNTGNASERLLAVRTEFGEATIRKQSNSEGAALPVDGVDLPTGDIISLSPGGLHIRFEGIADRPFAVGDMFDATLVFEELGEVTIEFWVEGRAAYTPTPIEEPEQQQTAEGVVATEADRTDVGEALAALMGPDIAISHMALIETAALVGWTDGDAGGRAFLRKTGDLWTVELLSGPSLVTPAGLRAQRLSPSAARQLQTTVNSAEADLSQDVREQIDGFVGTVFVEERQAQ